MHIRFVAVIFIGFLMYSCVSNKKILYLQGDTDLQKNIPVDSVLRDYNIQLYDYKLQHEDVLSIQISSLTPKEYDFFSLGLPQNSVNFSSQNAGALHGYLIDADGNIEFPVVGKVKLAGLTVYEAEKKIKNIAEDYLEEPVVRVRLLNFRFTVVGEVGGGRGGGGQVVNTYNNRISIMEAIGLAGGLTDLADRKNVKIIRQQGNDAKVFYVDLLQEDLVMSPYYYLHPNDIIVVPPLKQRPFRQYFGPNLSLIISSLSLFILVLNLLRSIDDGGKSMYK